MYKRISLNKDISDPKSYKGAISDKDCALLISDIKKEIDLMHKNGVWSLVDMPELVKSINASESLWGKEYRRECGKI